MTDAEVDADIARMLAVHRARKTLGYSWYEGAHDGKRLTEAERKRRRNARQQARRKSRAKPRETPARSHVVGTGPDGLKSAAELVEHTLTFALAGLDVREARRAA